MEKVMDRRIKKTKKSIQYALIKLLCKKNIGQITVQDIADLADINRSTFYLHYYDIYAVLEEIENNAVDMIFDMTKQYNYYELSTNPYGFFKTLLESVSDEVEFGNFLISSEESSVFLGKIKQRFIEKAQKEFEPMIPKNEFAERTIRIIFIVSGLIDTFEWWAKSNRAVSLDEFAKIISDQTSNGTKDLKLN